MADFQFSDFNQVNMPFAQEAEQAVLGCILKDPVCMSQVQIILRPEHFFLPQHQAIFAQMVQLETMGGKIDPLIVLNALIKDKIYDEAGGRQYLFQLAQSVPSSVNVESWAHIIREKAILRSLITVSQETIEAAAAQAEDADMLLDSAEQRLYELRSGKGSNLPSKLIDVIVSDVYPHLQLLSNPETAEEFKGLSTGFADLDSVIGGLNKSDLILLGARPAVGKTSVALNLARNVAGHGKKVVFFSLEMTKQQLAQRVWSSEAAVEVFRMRAPGHFGEQDWNRLSGATVALKDVELYLDDTSNITVSEIKARIRRLKNVGCVFIDYLGLLASDQKAENRVQEVSKITRALKMMAKDLNIPVVVCAQLSRATEQGGKHRKPGLADLRESGSIEQDADIVLMLYRTEYDPEGQDMPPMGEDISLLEIIVAKNRHGATKTLQFHFDGKYTRITQIAQSEYGNYE
ncbi:MAG: replicative DNA helicase [Oscillospiraceae bacterium]|jgi:replicative DNA helicase|nr:replicative DNA helicase [Oscillospiraceae bacterium]